MNELPNKAEIHEELLSALVKKERHLESELSDLRLDLSSDTKSTAGDKHETSRAMNQLEQERISEQLLELKKAISLVKNIDTDQIHSKIGLGTLLRASSGNFYLSIGHGALNVGGQTYFCLSPVSPFGKLLIGKTANERVFWQGKEIAINTIQ
jgi:transcription elongation GreA/GreB family factor